MRNLPLPPQNDLKEKGTLRVKSRIRKEIEIFRDAMPEPESKGGSAVQHKMLWRGLQFLPESPLRRRKNVECWSEGH